MNTLYARIFALVFATTVSFAVNAAQKPFDLKSTKAQNLKFTPGAVLTTGGVMLKTTGNEKLKKVGNVAIESGATAAIVATSGGTAQDVAVAMGIDAGLQVGTYCLQGNEYLQSIGEKIPGTQSKEGRANYRAFTSAALARIIGWWFSK